MNSIGQQKTFCDEYRILDLIGEGGMGRVYRARQLSSNRVVAVKVMSGRASDEKAFLRAHNEADVQKGLRHPNIAELYGQIDWNGQPCLVMEYINGVTLADLLKKQGPLPAERALAIFSQIVGAVAHIHDHDIVHRDIKPANIRLTTEDCAKLLDFGIAKSDYSPQLTQTGFVIGTVEYLSPELINGGKADQRSDIWALGILLYEMVAGSVPFTTKSFGTLYQQINRASFSLPAECRVPRGIWRLISSCLKKDPSARIQSAAELLGEVRLIIAQDEVATPNFTSLAVIAKRSMPRPFSLGQRWRRLALSMTLLAGLLIVWNYRGAWFSEAHHFIRVEPADGPAELYMNGRFIDTTPIDLPAQIGEPLSFELRRNGVTKPVRFLVTNNIKSWSEPLQTGF